jgi:hypothetical protein
MPIPAPTSNPNWSLPPGNLRATYQQETFKTPLKPDCCCLILPCRARAANQPHPTLGDGDRVVLNLRMGPNCRLQKCSNVVAIGES